MTGKFAKIKLEEEREQESCVMRLGDVRSRGNRMDGWTWDRFSKEKDAKEEERRREILDKKMHQVVRTVRKGLIDKDTDETNMERFETVVEELGRSSFLAS